MKKITAAIVLSLLLLCLFAGCQCQHEWVEATCDTPKTCSICGETEGTALIHAWQSPTCTDPIVCSRCGSARGVALGHTWQEATCTAPKTCSDCRMTEGDILNHEWAEATCASPKTCVRCSATDGVAIGHDMTEWVTIKEATCAESGNTTATCNRCGETFEKTISKLPHTEGKPTVTKEATLTENGKEQTCCTVCGAVLHEREIELTDEKREELYKKECTNYSYETIARNPDNYKGEMGYVYGKVIQVIEDGNDYTLRVAMKGSYSSVILVSYTKDANQDRILEDDWVKMYGIWYGTYTYESTMGASITVPLFFCEYLDIQ